MRSLLLPGVVIIAAAYVGADTVLTGSARTWAFVTLAVPAVWLFARFVRIIEGASSPDSSGAYLDWLDADRSEKR